MLYTNDTAAVWISNLMSFKYIPILQGNESNNMEWEKWAKCFQKKYNIIIF